MSEKENNYSKEDLSKMYTVVMKNCHRTFACDDCIVKKECKKSRRFSSETDTDQLFKAFCKIANTGLIQNEIEEDNRPEPYGDSVNHPPHYNKGNIECIDAMISAFGKEVVADFCLCNSFKYMWRHENKGGIEDIEKAEWYLNKYKKLREDMEGLA